VAEAPTPSDQTADSEQGDLIAAAIQQLGTPKPNLEVRLSRELVGLLSEQLYQSPVKAIEELVVNAYDADADSCRIALANGAGSGGAMVVFDDGVGMDEEGLSDLWHVGHSRKRDEQVEQARKRKQIGKFGIGKLSTYAVANRLTYISRVNDVVLATSLDYDTFKEDPEGPGVPVELPVVEVPLEKLLEHPPLAAGLQRARVDEKSLGTPGVTWTIVVDVREPDARRGR
jgi:histidine kinase/DNA gyrase B/HSP90-like ATPase